MSFIASINEALGARPYAENWGVNPPQPVLQPQLPQRPRSGSWLTGDSRGYHVGMCWRHAYASAPCDRAWMTAATPPGGCRCGQQEPQCRNASLQTLAQGLSTFLSPAGAVQVEGGREQARVSPQGRASLPPCPWVLKWSWGCCQRLGKDHRSILGQHTVGPQQGLFPRPPWITQQISSSQVPVRGHVQVTQKGPH